MALHKTVFVWLKWKKARGMVQQLRVLYVHTEELSQTPGTHMGWITTLCSSSFWGADALSLSHMHTHTHSKCYYYS